VIVHRALDYLERSGVDVRRGTFLDVGANIGTTTFAALEEQFALVVACEPLPNNVRILRANLGLPSNENTLQEPFRVVAAVPANDRL
jgi:FkbM family methyltransferase